MLINEVTSPKIRFDESVISRLLEAHHLNEWVDESIVVNDKVKFQVCPLFAETAHDKIRSVKGLGERLEDFKRFKSQTPTQPYGKSDTPFIAEGPLARAVPKLRHAHLTQDVSVFYTIAGSNPIVIKLYGVFSHKESGTGNSSNKKIQQNLAKQLANQDFI